MHREVLMRSTTRPWDDTMDRKAMDAPDALDAERDVVNTGRQEDHEGGVEEGENNAARCRLSQGRQN